MSMIADNIQRVCEQMADAAIRAGRQPNEVTLVAVTKTLSVERVLEGYAAGLRDFGENRVQEAADKIAATREQTPDARWHLIGQLQRNKVKAAVGLFDMLHSVDSLRLAEAINQRAAARDRPVPILLEVNIGGEATKAGVRLMGDRSEFWREIESLCALPHLDAQGLMTVAPFSPNAEDARPVFAALRQLRDELARRIGRALPHLSMGMSGDFVVAIEEGATLVRIGTALFGERMATH